MALRLIFLVLVLLPTAFLLTLAFRSYKLARRSPMMFDLRQDTSPATSAEAMRCFIVITAGSAESRRERKCRRSRHPNTKPMTYKR